MTLIRVMTPFLLGLLIKIPWISLASLSSPPPLACIRPHSSSYWQHRLRSRHTSNAKYFGFRQPRSKSLDSTASNAKSFVFRPRSFAFYHLRCKIAWILLATTIWFMHTTLTRPPIFARLAQIRKSEPQIRVVSDLSKSVTCTQFETFIRLLLCRKKLWFAGLCKWVGFDAM
jgi:hypothetical protein